MLKGDAVPDSQTEVISATERDAILNDVIAIYARDGYTISGVLSGQAIATRRTPLGSGNFWLNGIFWTAAILLTLFTGGLFLIVLGIMYLTRPTDTTVIRVDEYGNLEID